MDSSLHHHHGSGSTAVVNPARNQNLDDPSLISPDAADDHDPMQLLQPAPAQRNQPITDLGTSLDLDRHTTSARASSTARQAYSRSTITEDSTDAFGESMLGESFAIDDHATPISKDDRRAAGAFLESVVDDEDEQEDATERVIEEKEEDDDKN